MTGAADIAVLYLARHAEGLAPLERFRASYRTHAAGLDHQLVVLYKGYLEPSQRAAAQAVFAEHPHIALELDDSGFDIGSYVEAARHLAHTHVCLLNTFTELTTPGWLALLAKRATAAGVGVAGAMGSYESLYDSYQLLHKVTWLCDRADIEYDPTLHHYYRVFIDENCPGWGTEKTANGKALTRVRRLLLDARFRRHWRALMAARPPIAHLERYPRFPNPHIRTTGLMVRRERLLAFERGAIRTKDDALDFESGPDGLTARARRDGLAAIVVTKDDRDFDVADWPRSFTYRLGDQRNLLATDRQSRKFAQLDAGSRITNVRITWGDYADPPPADYPDLGLRFRRGSLAVTR